MASGEMGGSCSVRRRAWTLEVEPAAAASGAEARAREEAKKKVGRTHTHPEEV